MSISIKKEIGYKAVRWAKSRKYWIGERNPNWIVRRRENERGKLIEKAREDKKFDLLTELELERYFYSSNSNSVLFLFYFEL